MATSKLQDDQGSAAPPREFQEGRANWTWLLGCTACYAILLIATISSWSLWTDEAFSAYIASHRSLTALLSTLASGDSSDLQAAMYYIYLHYWTAIFGTSEVGLRSANIPFISLFAFTLVWVSSRVFRSRWMWIVPGSLPFLWVYAAQVRTYFALVAFSMVCFSCLFAYLDYPSEREKRVFPWLILTSLFIGTTFDMLMLLALGPMLAILAIYSWLRRDRICWAEWRTKLKVSALPFLALFLYLGWTFGRGTSYDYARPSVLSMGSVFYRFVGLLGYGPNRRYDIPFRPYLPAMALAGLVLAIALIVTITCGLRSKNRARFISLSLAFALGVIEVVILSVLIRQQMDVRHLASLVPLMLFFPLVALAEPVGARDLRFARVAAGLLIVVWLVADCRLLFLLEYKEEDFRSAVGKAIELQRQSGAFIALVADPPAGAYYGFAMMGARPCFPLADDCSTGFKKVNWVHRAPAVAAQVWKEPQITSWLANVARRGAPAVVIMSECRHPMLKDSAWWPVLRAKKRATAYAVHGFVVYFLP